MDYSSQYHQFAGGQAYGHFMPVPPLTPSHSHSAASDDFNPSPPHDTFDGLQSSGQFQGFDYPQGFSAAQQSAFAGPPTPPTNSLYGVQQQQQQQFQNQQRQQQRHSPLSSGASNGPNDVLTKVEHYGDDGSGSAHRAGGSDDDDMNEDSAPAQSKRKAQNRAAQRAFRERKEKRVKDLETTVADLQSAQQQASVENERLKADLQKMSTENEILRATGGPNSSHSPEPIATGPMTYQPVDFYSSLLKGHNNQTLSHRIAFSDEGERLLGAAATWDFIVNHELFKAGLVNIGNISEHLNHRAKCDGQGPVFAESTILDAIQLSVSSGSDDLL